MRPRFRGDRATGVFGSSFAFTVFLVFLLFAVQVLFGLYARTTVTAVASDVAQRAANEGSALDATRLAGYAQEGKDRLGRYGDDTDFTVSVSDSDGDGVADTVAVRVDADLPILLPVHWSGYSPARFTRTARARLEVFQEPTP